jgi:hypothetical protein
MVWVLQNGNRNGCEAGFVVSMSNPEGQNGSSIWKLTITGKGTDWKETEQNVITIL